MSMEKKETMADYESELEKSFRKIKEGDMIEGIVIGVSEEEVILDLKYYTQGVIKGEDVSGDPNFSILNNIREGDSIEAMVVSLDDGHGNIRLSRKEASMKKGWEMLKEYMEEEKRFSVKVNGKVKGGVVTYVEGIRGFIPASHIGLYYVEDLDSYVGKSLDVQVIDVDEEKKRLVLSAKALAKEREQEERNHRISMMVPGTNMEGIVESMMPYGAFIKLKNGLSGLVHISQMSMKRIGSPSEVVKIGDKVKVKVLNTNNNKISLSMKALEEASETEEDSGQTFQYKSEGGATLSLGDLISKLNIQ